MYVVLKKKKKKIKFMVLHGPQRGSKVFIKENTDFLKVQENAFGTHLQPLAFNKGINAHMHVKPP